MEPAFVTLALWFVGCVPPGGDLADNALWALLDEADDPLVAHKPEGAVCASDAWYLEGPDLEVFTGDCDYLALSQPLLRDVRRAHTLQVLLWHAPLFDEASDEAEAHVAVWIGEDPIWEETVGIPSDFGVFNVMIEPARAYRKGEPVIFHLHNHGANTWELSALRSHAPDQL